MIINALTGLKSIFCSDHAGSPYFIVFTMIIPLLHQVQFSKTDLYYNSYNYNSQRAISDFLGKKVL